MTLTYSTQRCILEHFEAHKRFLLAARCSAIQKVEKRVPLKLKKLRFDDNAVLINEIWYRFASRTFEVQETQQEKLARQQKNLAPGEVLVKVDQTFYYSTYVQLTFESQSRKFSSRSRRLPAQYKNTNGTLKQFLSIVLGGRSEIKVVLFHISLFHQTVLKLPNNFPKLHVQNVYLYDNDITLIHHLLDPKCFPLKLVSMSSWEQTYYQNSMITQAKCLILGGSTYHNSRTYWFGIFSTVPNKEVQMPNIEFTGKQIRALVRGLIDNKRENGTLFILQCSGVRFLNKLLTKLEDRFEGTEVTWNTPIKNEVIVSRLIAIPSTESEIVVYGVEHPTKKKKTEVMIRVMHVGYTTPVGKKKKGFSIPWFK